MTEHTAHEYGGRFLLELLQNSYDVHARSEQNGRISIRLDESEDDHGVLYVANTGVGFSESNVRAICNLGLSDKPVGEGIGNKGVGFKSVLQICDAPEIYSSDPANSAAPGFSFRFARQEDVAALVDGDMTKCSEVLRDVSLYSIPVPLEEPGGTVTDLRHQGFVTVIRMPLRSSTALTETRRCIDELTTDKAPVLLFLQRVASLSIEHITASGTDLRQIRRESVKLDCHNAAAERVKITEAGEFFVFSKDIDSVTLRETIRSAVGAGLLDERWLGWEAPASISVAVPACHEIDEFRSYTYLPLGPKAIAPFAGHLNAPFFTNLARLDLDFEHPLNDMLLKACAGLAVVGAQALSTMQETGWEKSVVDLLSWRSGFVQHLLTTDEGLVGDLKVLPTGRDEPKCTSMAEAYLWPLPDADVLTPDLALEAADVPLIWNELGSDRTERLSAAMAALGYTLDPAPELLAEWTEKMAKHCIEADMPLAQWDLLYDDIACMFEGDADVLTGRSLLLSDDYELRPCSGQRVSKDSGVRVMPFFPPVRQRTEDEDDVDAEADLRLPSGVRNRIFYLHAGLTWYDENREQTRARSFLQNHHLVRRFDARSLLEHLRSVLSTSSSRRLHQEALRFVFNLHNSPKPLTRAGLADLGLRVPNAAGEWIPATNALFSRPWSTQCSDDISLLAGSSPEFVPELAALGARLLASPEDFLRPTDPLHLWLSFLRNLGVQDGLPLLGASYKRRILGGRIGQAELLKLAGIPSDVVNVWQRSLRISYSTQYRGTDYVAKSPVFWLPGQATVHHLSTRRREAYARLVVEGLSRWTDECFHTVWDRDRPGYKDSQSIPTPLTAFLRTAQWLPTHDPLLPTVKFSTAADSWYHSAVNGDSPRYSPLISGPLRMAIKDDPGVLRRLQSAGVGMWTERQHAFRLIAHLGELAASGLIDGSNISQFQQSYVAAWSQAATLTWPSKYSPNFLVVEEQGKHRPIPTEELCDHAPLVVADRNDDSFALKITQEFGQPMLKVVDKAEQIANFLALNLDDRISSLATVRFAPILDGDHFVATKSNTVGLLEEVPWLREVFAVVLAHRWPNPTPLSERVFQHAVERLSHVRVASASNIRIQVGQEIRSLPTRLRNVLPIPDEEHPTLAIQKALDWGMLEVAPEALLQLIGHRVLATELELVFHKLRSLNVDFVAGPSMADIAEACDLETRTVDQTLQRVDAAFIPVLEKLYPFVRMWVGPDLASPFAVQAGMISSDEDLASALRQLTSRIPVLPQDLISHARGCGSIDALRVAIGVGLSELNAVLKDLQPLYRQIDYTDQHAEDFELYIRSNWTSISNRMRWAVLRDYRERRPIANWSKIREPKTLAADPAWGRTLDALTEAEMSTHLERQLLAVLGQKAPASGPKLPDVAQVRHHNVRYAEREYGSMGLSVRSWSAKNGQIVSDAWSNVADPRAMVEALDAIGSFDFEELSLQRLLEWLRAAGIWPTAMPLSLEATELGLSQDDLNQENVRERTAKQERLKARQSVSFNGIPIDVSDGHAELREKLEISLAANPKVASGPARFTKLEELSRGPSRRRTDTPSAPIGGKPVPRSSHAQLAAIGFAGELIAYKWLGNLYGPQFTEDCWVSTNRSTYFTGAQGDDGCGFDFLVPTKGGALMYEVKATTGEAGEFQLGESEVRQAQMHARNDRWRLIIVSRVLSEERKLYMLHNPFSPRSKGMYLFAGEGLRIRFAVG
ncbi:sacsin N-terminal ATP-binding-like domain-containing protein [Paenarthrobacter aromaticivorans]|uniref:sacsin N-terminal ATP-binding-like domain-containing protein n=1 Tax=Paenarthrobacter aromaticivorans TaxID=2849150 RepID=UPI003A809A8C